MKNQFAIIMGAGPAGLTAAYELLDRTDIKPIVFEATNEIGGIAKTVEYKGNRMDIGGHRFFSKSDLIMKFWENILPLQGKPSRDDLLLNRPIPLSKVAEVKELKSKSYKSIPAPDPEREDEVLLFRSRSSRIFYKGKFFDYPVSLNFNLVRNLGLVRITKIGLSYFWARLFPRRDEISLEDFFINRFGQALYSTFFKDYTEKVWGIPCSQIKADWGTQRVKGLSTKGVITHALKSIFSKSKDIKSKEVETSLIGQFVYPKYGPGQMWKTVASLISDNKGTISLNHKVVRVNHNGRNIISVGVLNTNNNAVRETKGDYFFSTMPVKDLINSMHPAPPIEIRDLANQLVYRDFITAGLLLRKLKVKNLTRQRTVNNIIPDNWIYIQEKDVKVGRLQIFNNWSPYMVKDFKNTVWLGMEYFCNEGDELWQMSQDRFLEFAVNELVKIKVIEKNDVIDGTVIRVPKTYPTYFGQGYDNLDRITNYVSKFENLFLIGRNGMHRYNNMDHSMLAAMVAVENIIKGKRSKENIWAVNIEGEYNE